MVMDEKTVDYLMIIPAGGIYLTIWPIFGEAYGFASAAIFLVFSVLISEQWSNIRRVWFWVTVFCFIVIHALILMVIDIPNLHSGLVVIPFGILDLFLMLGITNWIGRHFFQKSPEE